MSALRRNRPRRRTVAAYGVTAGFASTCFTSGKSDACAARGPTSRGRRRGRPRQARSDDEVRERYFFLAAGFAPPPPNGFGGSATPPRPGAELPAAFGFLPFAGGFAGAAGGSGGVGATAATTGGGASGGGALAALATEADGDVGDVGAAAALAAAAAAVFAACGESSEAPAMISAAVPTTTHTPTSTRQTRSAMLGFGTTSGNDADTSEGVIARWLGNASGA